MTKEQREQLNKAAGILRDLAHSLQDTGSSADEGAALRLGAILAQLDELQAASSNPTKIE